MNLLITGAWQCTEAQLNEIKSMGHELFFLPDEKDELPCSYDWVEGVICNGLFFSHPVEKFPNLKLIQLTSAGYDRVPMDDIKAHHIKIYNAKGVYSIPMAEFALCGVLQLCKQSRFFYQNQKQHQWEKHRNLAELNGKSVLIVGCGNVGTECAKRFAAFGCKVIGVERRAIIDSNVQKASPEYPKAYVRRRGLLKAVERFNPCKIIDPHSALFESVFGIEQLNDLLERADIVVLTLPLTEESRHLMNRERLGLMKNSAVLVNIARGGIVDEAALIEALNENKIGGAVLDVFENEPLSEDSPLWDKENVIVSPHNSFAGDGNGARLSKVIIENLTGAGV